MDQQGHVFCCSGRYDCKIQQRLLLADTRETAAAAAAVVFAVTNGSVGRTVCVYKRTHGGWVGPLGLYHPHTGIICRTSRGCFTQLQARRRLR